jgi:phenylalanyl-tRNA synthetase beta chain
MDITTNRVDAMNHYGVAREAAAIYGLALPALDLNCHKPARGGQDFSVN